MALVRADPRDQDSEKQKTMTLNCTSSRAIAQATAPRHKHDPAAPHHQRAAANEEMKTFAAHLVTFMHCATVHECHRDEEDQYLRRFRRRTSRAAIEAIDVRGINGTSNPRMASYPS